MEAYDPYDSIRFHTWNHDLQTFHAIPCMEPYDSMHGNGMNLSYGAIWFHGWNRMEDL